MNYNNNDERENEELLRELACVGNLERIRHLFSLNPDLNINAQNRMNGWTCLHWAVKRSHVNVVKFLLDHGADKNSEAFDNTKPIQYCTNEFIQKLLIDDLSSSNTYKPAVSNLSIVPNYLRHPQFPYLQNPLTKESSFNSNNHCTTQDAEEKSVHPSSNEIILLCRIADGEEQDFVEFEFDKTKCSNDKLDCLYVRLLSTICDEMNIELKMIKKIRKLPSILIRNDKDVERLKSYQMLEIILNS